MKNLKTLFLTVSILSNVWLNAQYKVTVYSAYGTQFNLGEDLGNAIDGLMNTIYQTGYNTLPDTLDFKFVDAVRIDSMIYCPRTDNISGNFGLVSAYWASKDKPDVFIPLGNINYNQKSSAPQKVALNGASGIINPCIVRLIVKTSVDNRASCAEMVFKSKLRPATPTPECDPTTAIIQDSKATIVSATASSYQPGMDGEGPIAYSFDGDYKTFYHSAWSGGCFPMSLVYNVDNADRIDYMIYYPRPGGGNGVFYEGEIWYTTKANPGVYIKSCDFNFNGSASASKLVLPSPIAQPASVKIVVKSGENNFASCAEIEFYRIVSSLEIPSDIFADGICSNLKPTVTQAQINALADGFFKSLAQCMLNGTYRKKFRLQSYEPYQTLATTQQQLKVSSYYSAYENPTGIFFRENSTAIVFVENTFGQSIGLRVSDYDAGTDATYMLQTGLNKINITTAGLAYINYYTDDFANLPPVRIHIVGGIENGYYDLKTDNLTTEEWKKCMLYSPSTMFNLRGKYINMLFRVTGLKQYSPEGPKTLVQAYDTIVKLQYTQMGLLKYNRIPRNRMQAEATDTDGNWNGGGGRAHFGGALDATCDAKRVGGNDSWGIAHELGHCNQIGPNLKWVSTTEVTNNIYSVWATYLFKAKPYNKKLETEDHNDAYYNGTETGTGCGKGNQFEGARFNAFLNNAIVKKEPWMCQFGPDAMCASPTDWQYGNTDHFVKLCPLWQLELYNQVIHPENFNWFGDLAEQVRLDPDNTSYTHGQCLLNFMKNTCDVLKLDLTDFFRTVRMLTTYDKFMIDYGSAQLTITDADTTTLVNYIRAKGYPKPECPLYYLSANSVDAVKNKLALEGRFGEGVTTDFDYPSDESYRKNIVVDHSVWKNAMVFETYNGKILSRISMVGGGYPNNDKTRVYYPTGASAVYAVGWNGTRKLVYGVSTDINLPTPDSKVSVFPNPCKKSFSIKGLKEKAAIKISDLSGKILKTLRVNDNQEVSTSGLMPGCYLIQIQSSKGIENQKLLIE